MSGAALHEIDPSIQPLHEDPVDRAPAAPPPGKRTLTAMLPPREDLPPKSGKPGVGERAEIHPPPSVPPRHAPAAKPDASKDAAPEVADDPFALHLPQAHKPLKQRIAERPAPEIKPEPPPAAPPVEAAPHDDA